MAGGVTFSMKRRGGSQSIVKIVVDETSSNPADSDEPHNIGTSEDGASEQQCLLNNSRYIWSWVAIDCVYLTVEEDYVESWEEDQVQIEACSKWEGEATSLHVTLNAPLLSIFLFQP